MPSFGGEVKPSVPYRNICGMKKNPAFYVEVGTKGGAQRAPYLKGLSATGW
jgi:hypothetical protein